MKIRSITYFCNPRWPLDLKKLRAAGDFLAEAKAAFEQAGYEVQSVRLATTPFPMLLGKDKLSETPRLAEQLGRLLPELGIGYAALGPAQPSLPGSYPVIPEAIAASQNIFFSAVMAEARHGISMAAVKACAQIIVRTSTLEPNGFANLNFAALANVPPGSPFFPAAYHVGVSPSFAIATEAADLAVQAFSSAGTLAEARQNLITLMERHAGALTGIADALSNRFGVTFSGIDYSLAPFPSQLLSLGHALELLGVPGLGRHGSLAAAAFLADTMDRAQFSRAGFSGLFLPLLEDAVLAQRAAEGLLSLTDLLLYSAVCGTGLDTVPLPGDASPEQLAAVLLDVAALSSRLEKPLTARLMPVPGKRAGDPTGFDFAFFANSRVLDLKAAPLSGLLRGDDTLALRRRP